MNILIIDDDEGVTNSLGSLMRLKGHVVSITKYGNIPHGFYPDTVICDYDLGMFDTRNGAEIVTDLMPEAPAARWIICSGLTREVPEGVEFFSKSDFVELLASLEP